MPDTNNNIIIDISTSANSGTTASMATDYGNSGNSFGDAHIPVSKVVWGDSTTGNRVTYSNALPIGIFGQSGPVTVDGTVEGSSGGKFFITNYVDPNLSSAPFSDGATGLHYVAVAGSTNGTTPVGVTGQIQGIYNGVPVAVTGDVRILGAMGSDRNPSLGENYNYVVVAGSSAGDTGYGGGGEIYGIGSYGVPIATTGGRRLSSAVDSVTVVGSINATGGRQLKPSSDSVVVYGTDQTKYIPTILYRSRDGATAGFSGDSLKVAITNAAQGITFSVALQSVTAVKNDGGSALIVQGATSGSGANPVIVRGENSGALEVYSNAGLNTSVSNTVTIDDTNITNSLESSSKPLISNLQGIKNGTNEISSIKTQLTSGNIKAEISKITKPTALRSGSVVAQTNTNRLSTNLEISAGITLKSHPNNDANILVGSQSLTRDPNNGYLLEPGESVFIEINNANKIYLRVDPQSDQTSGTNRLFYIGS